MNRLFLILTFLLVSLVSYSQNCRNGQCLKTKSDGYQCKRCAIDGDVFCSSHSSVDYYDIKPSTPSYYNNTIDRSNDLSDCKYSQCSATKADGTRCRRCTGSLYSSYCSSHD